MARHIPFTIQRSGTYCFNLRTPEGVLRVSLRTKCPMQALTDTAQILNKVRAAMTQRSSLKQLKHLVRDWLDQKTLDAEMIAANLGSTRQNNLTIGNPPYQAFQNTLKKHYADAQRTLETGRFDLYKDEAERLLQRATLEPDEQHTAFLSRELAIATTELFRRLVENDVSWITTGASTTADAPQDFNLTDLSGKWLDSLIRVGKLVENSERTYREALRKMFEILGENITTAQVNKALARKYRDELLDYPVRRTVGKGRNTMSLEQVKAIEPKRLSASTVATEVEIISGFGAWMIEEGYLVSNPFVGMAPDIDKEELSRDPFTKEEQAHIFGRPLFQGSKCDIFTQPPFVGLFWAPIIGAFTGARLEEICRIRKKDVKTDGAITYIELMPAEIAPEISERRGKKAGKTSNANRHFPIHPALEEIGFLDFVASRESEGYIFDLDEQDHKRGHYVGKRFNTYLTALGYGKNKKTFNSFRHSLINRLRGTLAHPDHVKALVGHSLKNDTTELNYGTPSRHQPTVTAQTYFKVDFSDIAALIAPWDQVKSKLPPKRRKLDKGSKKGQTTK